MKLIFLLLCFIVTHLNTCTGNLIKRVDSSEETVASSENFVNSTNDDGSEEESWNKEQWIEVPLDHFNLFDNRTWKMRYFINDEFFQEGMPLFVEIGGEWTVGGYVLTYGQLHSLAKKHHGYLVATEHRYYGKSLPLSTDFSTENLRYLQIEQALEDLVYLIEHVKTSTPGLQNSKVVVHGCSYAGMLASWVRSRFPHVVDIGYASSAPLGVGLDYPEYYEVVNDVYANVSISCIDTIKKGFNATERLLRTEDGREIVKKALKGWTCGDIDEMNSVEILWTMMGVLNVQYDPVQYEEVGCLVLSMDADELSACERLANFVVLKSKDKGGCETTNSTEEEDREGRAWTYQTCTEVGFFQTLNRQNSRHPFAMDFTIEESVDSCVQNFGEGVTEKLIRTGIDRVIRRYGGTHPRVTKLLSVHGSSDPWKALGKSEEDDPEAPVIILKGSHCVDDSEGADDPVELIKARENIRNIVSRWIRQISRKGN